jgi:hypothetical protein
LCLYRKPPEASFPSNDFSFLQKSNIAPDASLNQTAAAASAVSDMASSSPSRASRTVQIQ